MLSYIDFIKKKGKPMSEINPGSKERALSADDALLALEILKNEYIGILGGDILSIKDGELCYAIHLWGYDYHYLNWYCDRATNESEENYINRSYHIAIESIKNAIKISNQLEKECYVVFVI